MPKHVEDPKRHAGELRRAFAAQLPGKIEAVEALWDCVQTEGWNARILQEMRQSIHALASASAAHGLKTVVERANELENFLEILLAKRQLGTPDQRSQVNILLGGLNRAATEG